ncbi:hypothetical protein IFM61606_08176 [Aspergillus udagawae]|uniref:GPI anchored serine-threonine rich protein n=1 Tax=Aspergillus udagawae TaxID=91492 RepID=A0A8H3NVS0_9EURO|nr:uncharacterized protein Aud_008599 [Aspergillus udagawae]GFF39225.1 hypothetical protein IFM46972_05811 [Aspergillus udagawae]GFF84270.1 hypothetical protein IFM53868_04089 [Aspergillus udagawae]GFG02003.1 hypothetical protein IFM5058_00718 [Aspergillus udagawae]GFG28096.1 hypothetical protein IFM61606_08176 [Aspergillus udagawae]GIC92142.1 hypothetical protein Aud_008599 [Aspergillus udagawae]
MQYFTSTITLLVAFTGFTLAQQTSTAATAVPTAGSSSSTKQCAAQNIVDACLASMKPQFDSCGPNDWKCLCDQSINVLTCYNNCPGHPDSFGAEQTKQSYCNAAGAYSTLSSSTATATTTTTSATKTTETAAATTTTSSGFSPSASKGAAAGLAVEGGSLLAAVFAGLVVL